MRPIPGALRAVAALQRQFEVYLLSTAPWNNPSAWTDKLLWVKTHFGETMKKRLTISHNKQLSIGDYLIDDRTANGAGEFQGEHVHFGTASYPDWPSVLRHLGLVRDLVIPGRTNGDKFVRYVDGG